MRKKQFWTFVLIGSMLFSACNADTEQASSTPISLSSGSSSASVAVSSVEQKYADPIWDEVAVQKAYNQAEIWQKVYYDLVVSELNRDPKILELYFPLQGDPLLVLDYGSEEDTLKKQYRAWYIENQQVKILFEGAAQRLAFDRDDGILSMVDLSDQKTDTPDTTREQLIKNSVYKAYDGPDVSLRLTVGFADEVGVPTIKQRVADFFLDVYQPTVPEGAPAWVGEYIKYIYTHLDGPYMTEEPDFWNHGTIQGMILYKAAPDSAPIMYVRDILPDGWLGEYYYLGGRGRYTAYHIYGLNDATIYDDESGHTIIKLESSFTDWYIVGSAGWNQLFGEGWLSPVLPSAVYINGESADFELGEEENVGRWLEPRRMQAFVSNGMGSILLPQEGITYELAQTPATADADTEITPWNEVEQMLIDAFCDFARRTGQMK